MSDGSLTRFFLDGTVEHRDGQQFINGKGLAGDSFERVHRLLPHGFWSWPVKGGIGALFQSRGQRDSAYVVGGEKPSLQPGGDYAVEGASALYDHIGNIVSVVAKKLRIVHASEIYIQAPRIVLDGLVLIGGPDASNPASMQGTIDSAGHIDVGGLASKVLLK